MTDLKAPSSAEWQEARDLLVKIRTIKDRISKRKLFYYVPIGNQPSFHASGTAEIRVVFGGNRSGKTTSGAAEAVAHSLGYRPWLPNGHVDRIVRNAAGNPLATPNIGRIIGENFEVSVVQTIHPKIMEWAPSGSIKNIQKNQRGVPVRYDFYNGSVIHLLSNDQDDRVFEGPNGHWAWFDEPTTQRKFNGIRRGLVDFDGTCWMTMTPLAEPWINEVLVSKANEPDGRIKVFYYSIWDNCVTNGGTLSQRAIMSFLEDLPEEERQAREFGVPLHLAGLVFPEWRPEPPYYIDEFKIPQSWPRVCVIDPHPRKPVAVLWATISPDGIIYVYRSLFDRKLRTIEMVANRIKELEGWTTGSIRCERKWDEYIALRIIDTSANQEERTSGTTVAEQFATFGIDCVDAYKRNKEAGMNAIREALAIRGGWQKPGLVVTRNCVEVKQNFQNYVWERWATSRQQGLKGDKQEAVKNHDDFIDCIRYIFQMRLTYRMLRDLESKLFRRDDWEEPGMPLDLKENPHGQRGRWKNPKPNRWT